MLMNTRGTITKSLLFCLVPILGLLWGYPALATPSSTYFTPCTIDIQPAGVTHLGVDNYFGFGSSNPADEFATDVGPEWGAKLSKAFAVEYGCDILSSAYQTTF